MKRYYFGVALVVAILAVGGWLAYQKIHPSNRERHILYWTDPMIPGDRADHPGKSPMGMDRIPVYEGQSTVDTLKPPEGSYYTCPMHPSVRKNGPGVCPICGMTLVRKVESNETSPSGISEVKKVSISPSRQVLANVSTLTVRRIALRKEIHASGSVESAEPNLRSITMRFPGRVEKLYLTYTGQRVRQGDPVAAIYSPEAISAEHEYLLAKASYEEVKGSEETFSANASDLLAQSRDRLLQWGITEHQISELDSSGEVKSSLTIYSPVSGIVIRKYIQPQQYPEVGQVLYDIADLSTVWMNIDIYEYELSIVHTGQEVTATSDAYPGQVFSGTITFISPTVDPTSRTARARVSIQNATGELKPEMFMTATLKIKLPPTLAVPIDAVVMAGTRRTIWIQTGTASFEPRPVTVGVSDGHYIQILSGLNEGDRVVASGGYLLDSESQLESANSPEPPSPSEMKEE